MPTPTVDYRWATEDVEEIVSLGGSNIIVDNKVEPTESYINTGIAARQPWPQPYVNYILNSHYQWLEHLLVGEVGDFKLMPTATTVSDMTDRFTGTWTDLGTTTLTLSPSGSQTLRLFTKAA